MKPSIKQFKVIHESNKRPEDNKEGELEGKGHCEIKADEARSRESHETNAPQMCPRHRCMPRSAYELVKVVGSDASDQEKLDEKPQQSIEIDNGGRRAANKGEGQDAGRRW